MTGAARFCLNCGAPIVRKPGEQPCRFRERTSCDVKCANTYRNQHHNRVPIPAADRFWAKVNRDGPAPEYAPHLGPCWLWMGTRLKAGYGRFSVSHATPVGAHRYAYELVVGPIPAGLVIDHLCRVPACVNPAHLEAVTSRENTLRGMGPAARAAASDRCKRGHLYDDENTHVYADGSRRCRACARLTRRLRTGAAREPANRADIPPLLTAMVFRYGQ